MIPIDEIHIKSQLEDLEMDFSTVELWQKLENEIHKPKRKFTFWPIGLAASMLLVGLLTVYRPEEIVRHSPIIIADKTEINQKYLTNSKKLIPLKSKAKSTKVIKFGPRINSENFEKITDKTFEEPIGNKLFENELAIVNIKAIEYITVQHKSGTKPKMKLKDRSISFNLPLIPDELMQKEPFAKRLGRQLRLFNTEGRFDWTEINVEPPALWVFRKSTLDSLK